MPEKKSKGGARPGAGRKRKEPELSPAALKLMHHVRRDMHQAAAFETALEVIEHNMQLTAELGRRLFQRATDAFEAGTITPFDNMALVGDALTFRRQAATYAVQLAPYQFPKLGTLAPTPPGAEDLDGPHDPSSPLPIVRDIAAHLEASKAGADE